MKMKMSSKTKPKIAWIFGKYGILGRDDETWLENIGCAVVDDVGSESEIAVRATPTSPDTTNTNRMISFIALRMTPKIRVDTRNFRLDSL